MSIVIWHSENKTLYYIVDDTKPEDEQPAVMMTCYSLEEANNHV